MLQVLFERDILQRHLSRLPYGSYTSGMASLYLEIMMPLLQEVKELTKELYFITPSRRKSNFRANFRFIVHMVYLF